MGCDRERAPAFPAGTRLPQAPEFTGQKRGSVNLTVSRSPIEERHCGLL